MFSEQGFLRTSIFATVAVAAFGIVFGLLSGSFSIAFDGAYSLGDAGMTILALWVSSLIVRSAKTDALSGRLRNRFTMGFWHLEPIVLGLNGILLIAVASYALINGVITILHGGNELRFGIAIVYAVVTLVVCLAMALIGTRVNRSLQSDFIALDVKAWIMSAGITSALLIAFLIGQAVGGTPLAWISPYVDPVVLALVCVVIIPLPIGAVRQALSEILLITPVDLKAHVDRIATETVQREGFLSHRAYAAKVGRATQIELYFIVPANLPPKSIEEWDRIRDQIGTAIGDEGHNRWLTIAFTADVGWAE
ncbi:cation transporter [Mesorhizobium sp.]|uniref:cation diffusion facilitator family transporter n=1 Tax=Mesorhizobium sp. TaxID=1871066 RepID=UPI000FE7CC7E|nr:cation transporter [Mesorhizobium sp.]RWO40886.1 MAG: cation transporter [Mesorhizobium sp.]TIN23249.1 MAG: cation transporter [Mesorhizobium sp.]TIN33643.1 MAG: cation transporter [Mesorhizobium sp.]TJU77022.1 MAG: cation transporter [Mesorhizobium sp.]TJU84202.1 MAG: cation transporter [Mesorhizobium sp.]